MKKRHYVTVLESAIQVMEAKGLQIDNEGGKLESTTPRKTMLITDEDHNEKGLKQELDVKKSE